MINALRGIFSGRLMEEAFMCQA